MLSFLLRSGSGCQLLEQRVMLEWGSSVHAPLLMSYTVRSPEQSTAHSAVHCDDCVKTMRPSCVAMALLRDMSENV